MLCIFLIAYLYAKNIFCVNGSQKLGQIADGKDIFLLNGLDARNIFAEIVLAVKSSRFETYFLASVLWTPLYHCVMPVFGRICITHIGLTLGKFCGVWVFT